MTNERTPAEIRASSFIEKALRQCSSLPLDVSLDADGYQDTGLVDLSGFAVQDDGDGERLTNQGYGSQGMRIICTNADIFNVDLEVYAGLRADGCDPDRLIGFYSRFGFVLQNAGEWKEETIQRPHLIRRHQLRS